MLQKEEAERIRRREAEDVAIGDREEETDGEEDRPSLPDSQASDLRNRGSRCLSPCHESAGSYARRRVTARVSEILQLLVLDPCLPLQCAEGHR